MKIIKNHINLFVPIILFSLLGEAQVISKDPKDLFVVGSESINFKSKINNSEYQLYINFPESYDNTPTKRYPVFYALDDNCIFGV